MWIGLNFRQLERYVFRDLVPRRFPVLLFRLNWWPWLAPSSFGRQTSTLCLVGFQIRRRRVLLFFFLPRFFGFLVSSGCTTTASRAGSGGALSKRRPSLSSSCRVCRLRHMAARACEIWSRSKMSPAKLTSRSNCIRPRHLVKMLDGFFQVSTFATTTHISSIVSRRKHARTFVALCRKKHFSFSPEFDKLTT